MLKKGSPKREPEVLHLIFGIHILNKVCRFRWQFLNEELIFSSKDMCKGRVPFQKLVPISPSLALKNGGSFLLVCVTAKYYFSLHF